VRGIVFDGTKAQVVSTLEVRPPGPTEVLVRITNAGVCHSDLSVIDGTIPFPTPVVLGHEGAGVVEEVGADITAVKPGDHVVMTTLASCGQCRWCTTGRPTWCRASLGNLGQPFTVDGQPAYAFAASAYFSEKVVVTSAQVVKIPDDVPLSSACLIGCGVVTGAGAVWNRAKVQRGQTAAVIGVGGVGLNVIQALRIAGATRIIAVDTVPGKEALAIEFGATDFVLAGGDSDSVEAVRTLVPGPGGRPRGMMNAGGVDWVFECVGSPALVAQGLDMLDWGGTVCVVGVAPPTAQLQFPMAGLTYVDRGIIGCRYGSVRPQEDIPMIVELYRQGRYKLDELVSAVHPLDELDAVVDKMHRGELARGVLTVSP
jgi:S-(hydroxymethyl)glutathione dehydrogenase/alcohol dehydrogenase